MLAPYSLLLIVLIQAAARGYFARIRAQRRPSKTKRQARKRGGRGKAPGTPRPSGPKRRAPHATRAPAANPWSDEAVQSAVERMFAEREAALDAWRQSCPRAWVRAATLIQAAVRGWAVRELVTVAGELFVRSDHPGCSPWQWALSRVEHLGEAAALACERAEWAEEWLGLGQQEGERVCEECGDVCDAPMVCVCPCA